MKSFNLAQFYFKMGDDFNAYFKETKNPVTALKVWSDSLRSAADDILSLAENLENKKIEIDADSHMVMLYPKEKDAEKICENFVEKEILYQEEDFCEECEGEGCPECSLAE